jgi:ribose/xylose/arabinose/galactoside ABC-type transport system permease subunit
MNGILLGAVAGLAATVPMSLAMKLMHERLPEHEQYPLPPRAVTMEVAERAGVREHLDEGEREAATWAAHFGYGAACGALYGALAAGRRVPPLAAGVGFGLAVWAGSYLGWLPAAGILRPATEHPPRRNALMIAAHVVWGAGVGLAVAGLSDERDRR